MEIGQRTEQLHSDDAKGLGTALIGRPAASIADLYPRLLAMQRSCGASGFVVCSSQPATLFEEGSLHVVMDGTISGIDGEISVAPHSRMLVEHLTVSPLPVIFHPPSLSFHGLPARCNVEENATNVTLAFPAPLGAKGNGYVILFNILPGITAEQMIDLHRKALSVMRELLKMEFATVPALETLNEREIECLQLVGNGMKSEAIGERLNLSVHTVNAYLSSATTKLDAVNRIQAIAKAIRLGLIA